MKHLFGEQPGNRAVLNVGGFSNLSLIEPGKPVAGFDCGPGNVLLDAWIHQQRGDNFDRDGQWAASGKVEPALAQRTAQRPLLPDQRPKKYRPRSLQPGMAATASGRLPTFAAEDVQATLLELTALTIVESLQQRTGRHRKLLVCGGGAHNAALMKRLASLLPSTGQQHRHSRRRPRLGRSHGLRLAGPLLPGRHCRQPPKRHWRPRAAGTRRHLPRLNRQTAKRRMALRPSGVLMIPTL